MKSIGRRSAFACAFAAFVCASAFAQVPESAQIEGLGTKHPAARDISPTPRVQVYAWRQSDHTIIQINGVDGRVLGGVVMGNGTASVLPIGSLPANAVTIGGAGSYAMSPAAEPPYECPCSARVLYTGPEGTVIGIFDGHGNLVQVIVLPRTPSKPPQ